MAAYILNKSFINIAVAVMISIKVFSRMEGTFLNGLMETFFFHVRSLIHEQSTETQCISYRTIKECKFTQKPLP